MSLTFDDMKNKKILLIGGSGSLGNKFISVYCNDNDIYIYSRDECKHWEMKLKYNNINLILGDISNKNKLRETLLRYNFDVIINMAALKHIDICEYQSEMCINTNIIGNQNLLNIIEEEQHNLKNLKTCCFISTDKACNPVNLYGMCKAVSETLFIEKAKYVNNIKFVCVRYGNVLNSRGSIIPTLHKVGKDSSKEYFNITDTRMTRFVMTLEQSVKLIVHAILYADSGDIVLPKLVSCNIIDMIEIFSEIYNKPIVKSNIRAGEKLLESLINETQSLRMCKSDDGKYTYIKPHNKIKELNKESREYNSKLNPLTKEELRTYLQEHKLI